MKERICITEHLEPCPFCGCDKLGTEKMQGLAIYKETYEKRIIWRIEFCGEFRYYVSCEYCHSRSGGAIRLFDDDKIENNIYPKSHSLNESYLRITEEEAIHRAVEAWNVRNPNKYKDALESAYKMLQEIQEKENQNTIQREEQ